MLTGVVKIHDLKRPREMLLGDPPNPDGPIPQNHHPVGLIQTAPDGLPINPLAKSLGGFNRTYIAGRSFLSQRPSLLIHPRFGKDAAHLGFTRLGLFGLFAPAAFGLASHHRYSRPIVGNVKNWDGLQRYHLLRD